MKNSITALLFLTCSVFAASTCTMPAQTFISQLVSNHPSIKMSQEAILAAKARVESAQWGYYPTPSVEVSAKDGDRYTTTMRLDQPLWTGGKITSRVNMAQSKEQENFFELQESSYKLIENFLRVLEVHLQASSQLVELELALERLLAFDEMLARRIDSGVSSTGDKELLNARIEQINSDMLLTGNRLKITKMQLELMLGERIDCFIELEPITILHSAQIEHSIQRLLSFHPTLKKNTYQTETAKHELENTKASIMPNLSLRAEHQRGDLYNSHNKQNNQTFVYLTLSASTNAGLSALSDIQAARIKINELAFLRQTIERELTDALLGDFNNYEIAKSRIKILSRSVDSAANVLDSYGRLFAAGRKQWLDLVNASRELMQYGIELRNQEVTQNILAYKLALKNGQFNLLTGEVK